MQSQPPPPEFPWDLRYQAGRAEWRGSNLLLVFDKVVLRMGGPPDYTIEYTDASRQVWFPVPQAEMRTIGNLLRGMRREVAVMHHGRACAEPNGQMLWPCIHFPALKRGARGDLATVRYFWATPDTTWRQLEEFWSLAWLPLLRLLARCPEAAQLVQHNPGLAVLLAEEAPQWTADELRGLVRRKQAELCEMFGASRASGRFARMLARLHRGLCSARQVKTLLQAWDDPWLARMLPHLRLNTVILAALREPVFRSQLNLHLLLDMSRPTDDPPIIFLREWDRYCELIKLGLGPNRPLKSMAAICQWQQKMVHLPAKLELPLPPPPLPGRSGIEPITDSRGLIEEGRIQGNCAGLLKMQRYVIEGGIYLYRILYPNRATLCLRFNWSRNSWEIEQIRAANNKAAPPDVHAFAERWFAEVNIVDTASAA